MSDDPANVTLVFLGRLDGKLDALRDDVRELNERMTTLEIQVTNLAAIEGSHYASLAGRMDRNNDRLDRIERRLDIVPA